MDRRGTIAVAIELAADLSFRAFQGNEGRDGHSSTPINRPRAADPDRAESA
jgi:hypothetical protein